MPPLPYSYTALISFGFPPPKQASLFVPRLRLRERSAGRFLQCLDRTARLRPLMACRLCFLIVFQHCNSLSKAQPPQMRHQLVQTVVLHLLRWGKVPPACGHAAAPKLHRLYQQRSAAPPKQTRYALRPKGSSPRFHAVPVSNPSVSNVNDSPRCWDKKKREGDYIHSSPMRQRKCTNRFSFES